MQANINPAESSWSTGCGITGNVPDTNSKPEANRHGVQAGVRGWVAGVHCVQLLPASVKGSPQLLGVKRQPDPLPALSGHYPHQRSIPEVAVLVLDRPG